MLSEFTACPRYFPPGGFLLMGCSLSAAQIKHAEHVGPEATALPSVKPRETSALRRWRSEYGTHGIKEPALSHVCALCIWICVEMINLCVCFLYLLGFLQRFFPKAVSSQAHSRSLVPFSSIFPLSCALLHEERCENPVGLEFTGGFLLVLTWSKFLQVLE